MNTIKTKTVIGLIREVAFRGSRLLSLLVIVTLALNVSACKGIVDSYKRFGEKADKSCEESIPDTNQVPQGKRL